MLIGIISDSHDNVPKIEEAVEQLNERKIDALLHAGDFVAPFSIPPLAESGAERIIGVYGNNDGEKEGLKGAFEKIGAGLHKAPWKLNLDGKEILMMHEPYYISDGLENPEVDLIIYGHTHRAEAKHQFGKLIINPGELCGWITGRSSFVMIDTDSMNYDIIDI